MWLPREEARHSTVVCSPLLNTGFTEFRATRLRRDVSASPTIVDCIRFKVLTRRAGGPIACFKPGPYLLFVDVGRNRVHARSHDFRGVCSPCRTDPQTLLSPVVSHHRVLDPILFSTWMRSLTLRQTDAYTLPWHVPNSTTSRRASTPRSRSTWSSSYISGSP